jgi:hypothetical protein
MNRHELIVDDQCQKKSGWVVFECGVDPVREIDSITLPVIVSDLEIGLEIFSFSALYLTVPSSSAN